MTLAGFGSASVTAASTAALDCQGLLSPTVSPLLPALAQVATSPCCWWGSPLPATSRGAAQGWLEILPGVLAARVFNLGYSAGTRSA